MSALPTRAAERRRWLPPTPARFVRIELRLPSSVAGPERPIGAVCVGGQPR